MHPEAAAGVVVVRDQLEPAVVHLHGDQGRDGDDARVTSETMRASAYTSSRCERAVEAEQAERQGARRRQQDQQGEERDGVHQPHHVRLSMKAMMRAMPEGDAQRVVAGVAGLQLAGRGAGRPWPGAPCR